MPSCTGPDAVVAGFHRAFEVGAFFAALASLSAAALLGRVKRVPQATPAAEIAYRPAADET